MQQIGSTPRILVVDDEEPIRTLMQDTLEPEGYRVRLAANGQIGLREFFSWHPDVVVLDILMPGMDGWCVLERIREVSETPVIILSALSQEHDAVRGLKAGADDYVVKPLRLSEFVARVEAALRRHREPDDLQGFYSDSALYVDFSKHRVYVGGKEVDLSPTAFRLLTALVRNAGHVLSTGRLLDLCWGEGFGGPDSLRVYIGYLRKRLEANPRHPRLIQTVREFGYRYSPPTL